MTRSVDVEHATGLADGLGRLAQGGVDLVLLDLHLPDSGGVETLRRVQDAAPGVPVIVVTGSDDEALVERALQAGAADLVVKGAPHYVALLRHAVRGALERVQVLEALRAAKGEPAPRVQSAIW